MKKVLNLILFCLLSFLQVQGAASEQVEKFSEAELEEIGQHFQAIYDNDGYGIWKFLSVPNEFVEKFVDLKAEEGETLLILASQIGNAKVVSKLLEAKADINCQDNEGYTALMIASFKGYSDIVGLLLEDKRIKVDIQTPEEFTARSLALMYRFEHIASMLDKSSPCMIKARA